MGQEILKEMKELLKEASNTEGLEREGLLNKIINLEIQFLNLND